MESAKLRLGIDEESKQTVLENRNIPSSRLKSDEEEAFRVSCTSQSWGRTRTAADGLSPSPPPRTSPSGQLKAERPRGVLDDELNTRKRDRFEDVSVHAGLNCVLKCCNWTNNSNM